MLTFMNSKLPDNWKTSDKQYHIFQKSKSYEKSNTDLYIGEDLEFIIYVFKKKTSNLIKVISTYNIHSGIKSQQAKKPFAIQYQNLLIFFQNSLVPFHQIIFYHSILCVILIDKPNETFKKSQKFERNTQMKASKTQKHLKEISYPQKKSF